MKKRLRIRLFEVIEEKKKVCSQPIQTIHDRAVLEVYMGLLDRLELTEAYFEWEKKRPPYKVPRRRNNHDNKRD